jgi:hypothetical protein
MIRKMPPTPKDFQLDGRQRRNLSPANFTLVVAFFRFFEFRNGAPTAQPRITTISLVDFSTWLSPYVALHGRPVPKQVFKM